MAPDHNFVLKTYGVFGCSVLTRAKISRKRKFQYDVMTLQCWMHWFWITLWTVITVLPNTALSLPVPLPVGETSVDVSSILHQFPSVHNAVRQTKSLPPTTLPEKVVEDPEQTAPKAPPEQTAKPRNLLDVQNNKSLVAKNRSLAINKEQVKRNKVPLEKIEPTITESGSVFPVPQVDDSGDSEGGVPLQVAEAAVGLKPPEKTVTRASFTSPANKELELRYNAVIADSFSTVKPTEQPACNDCITTVTSQQEDPQQSAEQTENSTELDPVIAGETSNTEVSIDTNVENITGFTEINQIHEENTEGILSRSSLAVQETRDHPTGKMLSQASGDIDDQNGMDPGAIAGISLGVLAIATLAAAASFVLYRTRYLNNPQTLSDKCSNPDSSGYIDDSTMRENSEEMYSLDNDSFLNSLEAMTIQNYWTDSVKHTKL